MARARVIRFHHPKVPDVDLGTVTMATEFKSFHDQTVYTTGMVLRVGKLMMSPTGIRYYKVFDAPHWLSDHQVVGVKVKDVPKKRRPVTVYKA